jgi:uncharacterized protein (DUF697 family)
MTNEQKLEKANEIVRNSVGYAMSAGLVPVPILDIAGVSMVQLNMLRQLAGLYQINFMESLGKTCISAVVGGSLARVGSSLFKFIPGIGTILGEISMAAFAGASTYAMGQVFIRHFKNGGTFEDFNTDLSKKIYEDELKKGKNMVAEVKDEQKNGKVKEATPPATEKTEKVEDPFEKIRKLAAMKAEGILTDEEFQKQKQRLLDQL